MNYIVFEDEVGEKCSLKITEIGGYRENTRTEYRPTKLIIFAKWGGEFRTNAMTHEELSELLKLNRAGF